MDTKSTASATKSTTTVTTAAPTATEAPTAALVPYVSPLQRPADGTEEAARFRTDASAMLEVLQANEVNPRAIVLWAGVPRTVGDLVRAWRKETYASEAKRLHRK